MFRPYLLLLLTLVGTAMDCARPPAAAAPAAPAAAAPTAPAANAAAPEPAPGTAVAPPTLDALIGGTRVTVPLAELPARAPLAEGEDFKVVELGRDGSSSHHIVALRAREPLHRHDSHDLLVVTLEGYGSMLIGDEERPIGPRSIVYIPRGTVHAMRNTSGQVLYGYAVFTPPFDGEDRVPVAQTP